MVVSLMQDAQCSPESLKFIVGIYLWLFDYYFTTRHAHGARDIERTGLGGRESDRHGASAQVLHLIVQAGYGYGAHAPLTVFLGVDSQLDRFPDLDPEGIGLDIVRCIVSQLEDPG